MVRICVILDLAASPADCPVDSETHRIARCASRSVSSRWTSVLAEYPQHVSY